MRKKEFQQPNKTPAKSTLLLITLLLTTGLVQSQDSESPLLFGVGYFGQSATSGVNMASMAGGAEILLSGQRFAHTPSNHLVQFTSYQGLGTFVGPSLSDDNEFNSNTGTGKIQYTTPALTTLLGTSQSTFDQHDYLSFRVSMKGASGAAALNTYQCSAWSNCYYVAARAYTPILYYLSPPVVYFGSQTALIVDPRSTQTLKGDSDLPFIEARIDDHLIDFEDTIDSNSQLSGYSKNQIIGTVGDQDPSKSSSVNMKFKAGNAQKIITTMLTCPNVTSSSTDDCYIAKTLPMIESVSAYQGYTSGGQNLTIKGHGFDSSNITIMIDGVICSVQSYSKTSATCITGAQTSPSVATNFVGQHGLRRKVYNSSTSFSISTITSQTDQYEELALSLETFQNIDTYYGQVISGYFKAPATTNYRFYAASDDQCKVYLSKTSMDPSLKELIIDNTYATSYRNYYRDDGTLQSAWIPLTAGEYYYIEVLHYQGSGGDHLTVSVEIERATADGHYNTIKEVQRLQINPTNVQEQTRIIVNNPDSGIYTLSFYNPSTMTYTATGQISTNATAWEFQTALSSYYSTNFGSSISVVREMFDGDGIATSVSASSVQNVYTITLSKAINGVSAQIITSTKVSTTATIVANLPLAVQKSSIPLSGKFSITCVNSTGYVNTTADIAYNAWTGTIKDQIVIACREFRDNIEVWNGPNYGYSENGRDIYIKFYGIRNDLAQFTINSGLTTGLTGNLITYNSTTTTEKSGNLFYEPIPFDFLYTNEVNPQVVMGVNDLPAVCAGLACSYTYVASTSEITGFSVSGKVISITGTNLPLTLTAEFSNMPCTISAGNTANALTCTVSDLVSGSWLPKLYDSNGLIPIASTVTAHTIAITTTSVSPMTGLNPNGQTVLTISGSGFPSSLTDGSSISITFEDETVCDLKSISQSQIQCTTNQFNATSLGQSLVLTLTINGQTNTDLIVDVSSVSYSVTSITPSTHSPVLKANLTLQVNPAFTGTLSRSDLSVTLISTTDSTYSKATNVIDVDNTNKQIIVKYGGAVSGTYTVKVISATYGSFDTSTLTFTAAGVITSFTPTTGSLYGGTLVTITGQTFGTVATDNPVQISGTTCDVISTSATTIKCRTQARTIQEATSEDLIVFLKASEEATCGLGNEQCKFTWTSTGLPTLTQSPSLGFINDDYTIHFTGTGFTGTTSTVEVYIDGIQQTVTAVSSTQVTATVTGISSTSSTNIQIFFPEGIPANYDLLATGVSFTPKLLSISPQVGSAAGSLITASVKGLGVNTSGVDLVLSSTGVSICQTVTVPSYGVVKCLTKTATIATASDIKIKTSSGSQSCANSDTTQCRYSTSSTMSFTSSATKSSTAITFASTDYPTSGYTAAASYAGISADSVVIDSALQVTATFSLGIPLSNLAQYPKLSFTETLSGAVHYATVSDAISNTFTTPTASTASCSFSGGCLLTLSSSNLAQSLKDSSVANITVCGNKCTFSEISSSQSTASCYLPSVATIHSVDSYKVKSEGVLSGTQFSSNSLYTYALFDSSNVNGFKDTTAGCFFGMNFASGYVGFITEAKYFMNRFTRTNYIGNLVLQGSQDGITYTDLFTVGEEIHEGWNYIPFTAGSEPKYRYYRYYGKATGACIVGEISFKGYEVIDDSNPTYQCTPVLNLAGSSITLSSNPVTYTSTLTPLLTSISPRYGTVKGSETITFTGTNFVADHTLYTITIDQIDCAVQSATTISVTCITGKRPGIVEETTLDIKISGYGSVSTQDLVFRYVNYWSDEDTWGGEFLPMEGESVLIPKGLHLLVDIDASPILNAVIVEGSLIFPSDASSTHERTFDAYYIMVQGGYMEVGTEDFPYTSKITITMHGTKQSPEIPIYGNKCIAVREGTLDLHGIPRSPTWTELLTTANVGATTITLNTAVDWAVGEKIVIAPTSYENYEAEVRTIASINRATPSNPVITLDSALLYKHFAGVDTYGTEQVAMRAEVGLLTRNVVFRGDPETSNKNQFGAHIMLHSHGDESLTGRVEYIEMYDVGQAFQLGRYPLHFHLIGTVHNSYIKGNAVHDTYNRAVTIHGVHYLRIEENVAYNTMGHTFFIEDAAETKNFLYKNLAVLTRRSWSLLNTDQTPASFWITHPDNIFRDNHAAGSDRYGFWFDLQDTSTGPSFDPNICPKNAPLGEFSGNVAHSNGRYGLRIFHFHIPLTNPCAGVKYNAKNTADPYHQNPLVTANYTDFLSYKNKIAGAIAERIGDVRFTNFKVLDNLDAGIEVSLTDMTMDGTAQINNALVVGYSSNSEQITLDSDAYGVVTPRTENFQVNNVRFYNFNQPNMATLGSCSHCFHAAATDSGARTVTFSQLYFDATVGTKIRYQLPWRAIYLDTDGTLTGKGANTWTTPYWEHNNQPECEFNAIYDGLICDSTIQVRRLAFSQYSPGIFDAMEIKVLKYDESIISAMDTATYEAYILNTTAYSNLPFKAKQNPNNGWAIPFVTNHRYKVHWRYGLDWTQMRMDLSSRWTETDLPVGLVFNFTDIRAQVNLTTGGEVIPNTTLTTKANALLQTGDNIIYNDTATRQIHTIVNGKNSTRTTVMMVGSRCVGSCLSAIEDTLIESTYRLWSNASSWDTGAIPVEGETVEIKSGWNMILDLEQTPLLNVLQINGRLTFSPSINIHLKAKHVFVRGGELNIGSAEVPFENNATITLYGEKENQHIVFDGAVEAGNKVLANTGNVSIYGKPRQFRMARLMKSAYAGDTTITVQAGLDWVTGDKLALAPTTMKYKETDYSIIKSYDSVTGVITLESALTNYHYGESVSTAASYSGVDMRGEVFLLTRNVVIRGEDVESWGCQILTSDFMEENGVYRAGHTMIDNVEVYNCSQYDTWKSAIRFERSIKSWSQVSNSAFHHGLGWGFHINTAANVKLLNNVFFDYSVIGGNIQSSSNITIDGNAIVKVLPRDITALDMVVDPMAGLASCSYVEGDTCSNIFILNNIIAGAYFTGYVASGQACGDYTINTFKNNVAHSNYGSGAIIYADPALASHLTCFEASYFYAYKNTMEGAVSYFKTSKVIYSNMVLIDNGWSASPNIGQEGTSLQSVLKDSKIYGETLARDCPSQEYCLTNNDPDSCIEKNGIMIPVITQTPKPFMPKKKSLLPMHKVKSDASFGGHSLMQNVRFINFNNEKTWCGTTQRIFDTNPTAADFTPLVNLNGITLDNVEQGAVAYLMDPPQSWAVIDDCGEFPCTGPRNMILNFYDTKYTKSSTFRSTLRDFQIVSNNPTATQGFAKCEYQTAWNAYQCQDKNLGMLVFESQDEDFMDRTFSPIYIQSNYTKFDNTLNQFMDHVWDGFYTGQKRMSRFPSIIQTGTKYNISYTGTPPSKQRFNLRAQYGGSGGATMRIKYPKAGAYYVKDTIGNTIAPTSWDDSIKAYKEISGSTCGENRYIGVDNILEFYLKDGCTITVQPRDAIVTRIRLEWTLEEFYADGGSTKFSSRLAASLGIHESDIKVVAVYYGSVQIVVQIFDSNDNTANLKLVSTKLAAGLKSGSFDLGAPILDSDMGEGTITVDNGIDKTDPTTNNSTNNNGGQNNNGGNQYQNVTNTVTAQDSETSTDFKLFLIIGLVVGLSAIAALVGFLVYRKYKNDKSPVIQSKKTAEPSSQDHIGSPEEDSYEPQYHPKAEIGVFGLSESEKIKKKMNAADGMVEEEEAKESRDSSGETYGEEVEGQSKTMQSNDNIDEGTPMNSEREKEANLTMKRQKSGFKKDHSLRIDQSVDHNAKQVEFSERRLNDEEAGEFSSPSPSKR